MAFLKLLTAKKRKIVLLFGLAFLSACIAPDPEKNLPLNLNNPETWSFVQSDGYEIDLSSYWKLLNDPLLDDFISRAQENNFDLSQALAQLRLAQASLQEARGARLPAVSLSGGVARDFGDFSRDEYQFSVGTDLSWEVDLFGRISGTVNASEAELRASQFNFADIKRIIVATVATQTITARSLAAQLEIAKASLKNQEDNLRIAQWRNQAGLASSLDVQQARTQRGQTASVIPALQNDLISTANTISTLIGEAPGDVYRALLADPRGVPTPPDSIEIDAPAEILRMRPDIAAAEARFIADVERAGVARSRLYPLVSLAGNVGSSSLGINNLFDIITGNVVTNVRQLLFDGGRTKAQIDAADAIVDGSLAAWKRSVIQSLEDVETSAVGLRTSNERLIAISEASDGAQNAAILGRSQYESGLIDFQVLLTVEAALLNNRTSKVSAEASRAIAYVRLARAMGGGWQPQIESNIGSIGVR